MVFEEMLKRLLIDLFELCAIIICLLFLYTQMLPFVNAAIALDYINGQTISYTLYSLLLLILPATMLFGFPYILKAHALRIIFYSIAAIIVIGTVSDLIMYKFFIGYTFAEGNTVFVNIMWNMPNIWGALFSFVIAALYVLLGKWIKRARRLPYLIFICIFVLSAALPFLITYFSSASLPRASWLQKALFIIPEQFLILLSLTVCSSSRQLWNLHVWH